MAPKASRGRSTRAKAAKRKTAPAARKRRAAEPPVPPSGALPAASTSRCGLPGAAELSGAPPRVKEADASACGFPATSLDPYRDEDAEDSPSPS